MSYLPEFFKSILWSYDISRMDSERNKRTIIVQTINYGRWPHWQWLVQEYGRKEARRLLENIPASEFRPQALKLAMLLFGVKKMKYASRSAYIREQKNLAAS